MLWTGGKDCALAMHMSMQAGVCIDCLVTFAPTNARFRSHPLHIMQSQTNAIGRPWQRMEIVEPYFDSYRQALARLRDERGIGCVVTGDIAEVDGHPNWIRQCAEGLGIDVATPLWGMDRAEMLDALVSESFVAVITAVKLSALDSAWIGRQIDRRTADELLDLQESRGVDACGENGEFHTMVVNAPFFARGVDLAIAGTVSEGERAYAKYVEPDCLQR